MLRRTSTSITIVDGSKSCRYRLVAHTVDCSASGLGGNSQSRIVRRGIVTRARIELKPDDIIKHVTGLELDFAKPEVALIVYIRNDDIGSRGNPRCISAVELPIHIIHLIGVESDGEGLRVPCVVKGNRSREHEVVHTSLPVEVNTRDRSLGTAGLAR